MEDDGRSRGELIEELAALRRRVEALEGAHATTSTVLYGNPALDNAPLLAQVPAIVWSTDRDLRLTWWTGGSLSALSVDPDSVIGQDIYTYFGTDDPELPQIAAHRAALEGRRTTYEIPFEGLIISGHTGPLVDGDGRICGVVGIALDVSERRRAEEDRELLIRELRQALRRVKTLSGLVPICMHCKNVRNDAGFWDNVENWVREHSDAEFTHAICPDCMDRALERDGAGR